MIEIKSKKEKFWNIVHSCNLQPTTRYKTKAPAAEYSCLKLGWMLSARQCSYMGTVSAAKLLRKRACFTRSAYHYKGSRYYIATATRFPIPPQGLVPFFPSLLITGLLQLLFLNFQYLGGLQSLGMHMPFTFVVWHVIQPGFRRTRQAGDPHPVFSTRSSFILC
jgi:hypothetical protein